MGFRGMEPLKLSGLKFLFLFYFILSYLFIFFTSCDEAHLNGERFKKPLWNMIFFF